MSSTVKGSKKPFDKAAWRKKKYGHDHRVEQWKDQHRLQMKRSYKKVQRKDEKRQNYLNKFNKDNQNKVAESDLVITGSKSVKPPSSLIKAKDQFNKKVTAKKLKEEDQAKKEAERKEAIKNYKAKKCAKLKVLSAKTRKGQPVMAGRIELLLEKIQDQCKDN